MMKSCSLSSFPLPSVSNSKYFKMKNKMTTWFVIILVNYCQFPEMVSGIITLCNILMPEI